jgi:hypothetical protein
VAAHGDLPMADQVTLNGVEAQVYEAIATLEFIGYQVKVTDIAAASHLDDETVLEVLGALTRRGVLLTRNAGAESVYAPAHRGWSAAPGRPANPHR